MFGISIIFNVHNYCFPVFKAIMHNVSMAVLKKQNNF